MHFVQNIGYDVIQNGMNCGIEGYRLYENNVDSKDKYHQKCMISDISCRISVNIFIYYIFNQLFTSISISGRLSSSESVMFVPAIL